MCSLETSDSARHIHQNKTSKIFRGMAVNSIKHMFLIFRTILDTIIDFVFMLIWDSDRKVIPPLSKKHSFLALSAVELADRIRTRKLKSTELVAACIERIKEVNPILNAVTDERFEAAMLDAEQVDKLIATCESEDLFKDKPFLGVPFTSKESHAVAGLLHTLGIRVRRHIKASEDAECVRLMRAAGAIPLAVTNVPEINKWQEARNMVFGQTNNPYHTGRTTGGSSGGEAALMAAISTPISLCSVLRSGKDPTMASIGFVAKHCEDLGPLTKVVAGDKAHLLDLDGDVDLKKIKYYYVETAQDLRVSPICGDLRDVMKKVINHLTTTSSAEMAPESYYHRGFDYMYSLWRYAMTKEADVFARQLTNNCGEANGIIELGKKLIGQSEYSLAAVIKLLDDQVLPAVNKEWAERLISEMNKDLLSKLGDNGVLIFPSAPAPAPYHYSAYLRPFNFAYWGILNVMKLPSTQVPQGVNKDGIPLGFQVVSAPRQDKLCLAVAQHLSKSLGGYTPPCQITD